MPNPTVTMEIKYKCPECGHEWEDTWDSAVDADCPQCELRDITPVSYTEIEETPCPASS